jgi:hypothetical protein
MDHIRTLLVLIPNNLFGLFGRLDVRRALNSLFYNVLKDFATRMFFSVSFRHADSNQMCLNMICYPTNSSLLYCLLCWYRTGQGRSDLFEIISRIITISGPANCSLILMRVLAERMDWCLAYR